ncbi:HEAT repeat domain-containing protein [bacterium]|nr:HEAT repeat domain-containing protein [candidate division CSSED10-310 bacterium]
MLYRSIIWIFWVTVFSATGSSEVTKSRDTPTQISVLDRALFMTHHSREDINFSDDWDDHTSSIGRNVIIDDVLNNPFYTPAFVQLYGARFNGSRGAITPSEILMTAYEMAGGNFQRFAAPEKSQKNLLESLEITHIFYKHAPLSPGTRKYLTEQIQAFPPGLEESLTLLCEALFETTKLREEACFLLDRTDLNAISENPLPVYPPTDSDFLESVNENVAIHLATTLKVQKVDIPKIVYGAKILSEAIEMTRLKLQEVKTNIPDVQNESYLFEYESPVGWIVVGSTGYNRYTKDAALIVDLGGNDVYENNAAGSLYISKGVACVIDMGGDDIYTQTRKGTQGSGIFGVGILVDYDGNDTYIGSNWSQGSAFGGLGLLYDERGQDKYLCESWSQGAGLLGVGLNVDVDGSDSFVCGMMSQGFGSTMGFGGLINVSGDDTYSAGESNPDMSVQWNCFAQGVGLGWYSESKPEIMIWGGLGMLVDGQGNDRYYGQSFAQGAAWNHALGALVDSSGDDYYDSRQNSQAFGLNYAIGLLADQSGKDVYTAHGCSQGAGFVKAGGILLDYQGDDAYRNDSGKTQGYGYPPGGFGLNIDYNGNDTYNAGEESQGSVLPPASPESWPVGILINHRGADMYLIDGSMIPDRKNDWTWHPDLGAVGVDTQESPTLYFADQTSASKLKHFQMKTIVELEPADDNDMSMLGSSDTFTRFHAISFLLSNGSVKLSAIVNTLDAGHSEFRRTLEEAIASRLLENVSPNDIFSDLLPMLQSIDPETRRFCIERYAQYNINKAIPVIRNCLQDNEASVRYTAIYAIGKLQDNDAIDPLSNLVMNDLNVFCRRLAIEVLADLGSENELPIFREALRDSDRSVRISAAQAVAKFKDRRSIGTLQLLAASNDIHLKRAAGKALVEIGHKSGIPVLIGSIDYRSMDNSADTRYRSIPDFLMEYTNEDYGFDKESWQKWWSENERNVDLTKLGYARKAFHDLYVSQHLYSDRKLRENFNRLREQFPYYRGYNRYFAELFYQRIAPFQKTESKENEFIIQLAKDNVDLDPSNPSYRLMLSEIFLHQGEFDKANQVIRTGLEYYPDHPLLEKQLIIIRTAKENRK